MSMQADPYIGEIRMFAGNFAPDGWAMCDGQSLSINENQVLYALIGTQYGGATGYFNVPDLRGRAPIHQTLPANVGQAGGVESFTITVAQMPSHTHLIGANTEVGTSPDPTGLYFANTGAGDLEYSTQPANTTLNPNALTTVGANEPIEMWQPSLAVSYIIALSGTFPSQN